MAREKFIHYGHIYTLHIWWARRPLAAMRAAILALLLRAPDTDKERKKLEDLIEIIVDWDQVKDGNSQKVLEAAAIEPAISVFGRCSKIYRLDGSEVGVDALLDLVQAMVSKYALNRILNGGAAASAVSIRGPATTSSSVGPTVGKRLPSTTLCAWP